jgi:hypothetical protein
MGYVLSAKIVIPHQSCHNKVFEKYSPEWGLYDLNVSQIDQSDRLPVNLNVSDLWGLIERDYRP